MAQTTLAISMVNAYIAYSTNNSTWADISGYTNKVEPGPLTRAAGEVYTYNGDVAIVKSGKRQPLDIKFSFVYTEEATGPFKIIYDRAVADSGLYLRWAPKANTTGNYQFTSDLGVITELAWPQGDPDKGEPVVVSFTIHTPQATQAAIT